jgi:cysteinyl-tRNA synthetase
MTLRLYNTLTRHKDELERLPGFDPKNVRMYVCGPTVYDYAHIGNARPVIVFDVLYRLLRHLYGESHVKYVRNITDIDDKINARAAETAAKKNISVEQARAEITAATAQQYLDDVTALGCLPPTDTPRATEYVGQMVAMIERLVAAGNAYPAEGHVLFDVSSKSDYGKLSRRSLDEMMAGARVEVAPYKKNPMDFVLWKPSDAQTPGWPSPWGRGRPGWHIECSAMGEALLGETFDIHGGGIDLMFPHHENEIAQSESVHHGHALARIWMHNGFLQVEGEKMAKSLGNFITIRDLLDKLPGGALRLAMMQTHYRQPINWTASKAVESWDELTDWATGIYGSDAEGDMNLRRVEKRPPVPHPSVIEALSDDINTSEAVTALRDLYKLRNEASSYSKLIESAEFLGLFNSKTIGAYAQGVSGINLGPDRISQLYEQVKKLRVAIINKEIAKQVAIEKEVSGQGIGVDISYDGRVKFQPINTVTPFEGGAIQRLIDARTAARKAKDFKESDRIRDELLAKGIVLKDGPTGTTWEVKR